MPELPEVEGLRAFLADQLLGATIARLDVAAISALKTYAIPPDALVGLQISQVARHGKFLAIGADDFWLTFHLAKAGWLRWYDDPPESPAKPGKGPIALRALFETAAGLRAFDLTEAGTQKRLAIYIVNDLGQVPGIAELGVDPLAGDFSLVDFAAILADHPRTQIKGLLRDQRIFAGVGNAYSDEILHAAKLSPYAPAGGLNEDQVAKLYQAIRDELSAAVARAVGNSPADLKDGKRQAMRVHGRSGEPCPVCGSQIAAVSFSDRELNYCPGCQTDGKVLADRRMSRLLK